MKHNLYILALLIAFFPFGPAAASVVEPDYDPAKPPVLTPWFGHVGAAQRQADLDFIAGMRPHHAGALTMSQDYLKSPEASDPRLKKLAKGIIHNQEFELGMLNMVEEFQTPEAPHQGTEWRKIATKGLAQKQRFIRAPLPALWGAGTVSTADVQFAKAMIVHHEGALTMCDDYLGNKAADNKYLRLMCVDVLRDQRLDINFMNSVIADYPGNPDDVKVDASMIHGMEGMNHGHTGHSSQGHGTKETKEKPVAAGSHEGHGGHAGH